MAMAQHSNVSTVENADEEGENGPMLIGKLEVSIQYFNPLKYLISPFREMV